MPLGTAHFTGADLAVFTPEIWQPRINDFFKAKIAMRNFVLDLSDAVADGGDLIHIPNMTEMATNAKVNGSQVILQSPTETEVQLTVATWEEVSFLIEDRERAQVLRSYTLQERYAMNAGYAVAKSLDNDLTGLYTGLSQFVGDFVSDITDAKVREALEKLDVANVPAEDRVFVFYPTQYWNLLGIDRFVAVTVGTGGGAIGPNGPIQSGVLGMLYGVPVISTTQIVVTAGTQAHNLLLQKEAFALAVQSEIRMQTSYIHEYLGELTTVDALWGVVENRDAAAVEIRTIV